MADSVDPSQSDQVLQFGLNHTYGSEEHLTEASRWSSCRHLKVAWPTWSYVTFDLKRRHHICRLPYLSEFQDQIRNDWIPRFFSSITHHSGAGDTFDVSMSSPKSLPGRWRRSEGLNLPPVWVTLTRNTQEKKSVEFPVGFPKKLRATWCWWWPVPDPNPSQWHLMVMLGGEEWLYCVNECKVCVNKLIVP